MYGPYLLGQVSITFTMCCIGSKLPSRSKPWMKSRTTIASTRKRSDCESHDQKSPPYLTSPHLFTWTSALTSLPLYLTISHTRTLTRPRTRPGKPTLHRYHESTSSFAALATQSSMLSQSASALFDKDHPSMAGKGTHGIVFKELKHDQLDTIRKKIGLRDWGDES